MGQMRVMSVRELLELSTKADLRGNARPSRGSLKDLFQKVRRKDEVGASAEVTGIAVWRTSSSKSIAPSPIF